MTNGPSCRTASYVLITAAYNEQRFLKTTIESVGEQRQLPMRWVIVSDGSTDRTDDIVRSCAERYPFIELICRERIDQPGFASKVHALAAGSRALQSIDYEYIGHLDADVSFSRDYFQELLARFMRDPRLGLAGGFIYEDRNGRLRSRPNNTIRSVAGAVQMFRRECYEDIGQFIPLPNGGEDWHAEVVARMNNWRVQSFPDLVVYHHRTTGATQNVMRYLFRQGLMDYSMGSHPLFELAKVASRISSKPYVIAAAMRLAGYVFACCQRKDRLVSPEVVCFLRREQLKRLMRPANRSSLAVGGDIKG